MTYDIDLPVVGLHPTERALVDLCFACPGLFEKACGSGMRR